MEYLSLLQYSQGGAACLQVIPCPTVWVEDIQHGQEYSCSSRAASSGSKCPICQLQSCIKCSRHSECLAAACPREELYPYDVRQGADEENILRNLVLVSLLPDHHVQHHFLQLCKDPGAPEGHRMSESPDAERFLYSRADTPPGEHPQAALAPALDQPQEAALVQLARHQAPTFQPLAAMAARGAHRHFTRLARSRGTQVCHTTCEITHSHLLFPTSQPLTYRMIADGFLPAMAMGDICMSLSPDIVGQVVFPFTSLLHLCQPHRAALTKPWNLGAC